MEELGSRLKEYRIRESTTKRACSQCWCRFGYDCPFGIWIKYLDREIHSYIEGARYVGEYRRIHTGATDQPDPDA